MNYNRYIAFGIANGAIRITKPYADMQRASTDFFKAFPNSDSCSVRRVAVKINGETINDPEFKAKKVSKRRA